MAQAARRLTNLETAFNEFVGRVHNEPPPLGLTADAGTLHAHHDHLAALLDATLIYSRAVLASLRELDGSIVDNCDYLDDGIAAVTAPIGQAAYREEGYA